MATRSAGYTRIIRIITDIKVSGLFGRAQAATISNLTVAQGLSVGSNAVGAVVGYGDGGCTVENCQNSITVKGDLFVGGIAGSLNGGITNCQNSGRVDGGSNIGGIVGYVGTADSGSTISNCQNSGSVGSNWTSYRAGGTGTVNEKPIVIWKCDVFGTAAVFLVDGAASTSVVPEG